jgi:hypothetical protein
MKNVAVNWAKWQSLVNPALRSLRHDNSNFQATLHYIARLSENKKKKGKKRGRKRRRKEGKEGRGREGGRKEGRYGNKDNSIQIYVIFFTIKH